MPTSDPSANIKRILAQINVHEEIKETVKIYCPAGVSSGSKFSNTHCELSVCGQRYVNYVVNIMTNMYAMSTTKLGVLNMTCICLRGQPSAVVL